jgi:cell growth-regulating nucleolar protein
VLKKPKLDAHARSCYAASYSCLDCGIHFQGTSYRSHTSCISEDQKYQGKLYKEKKPKGQHQKRDSAYHEESQLSPHTKHTSKMLPKRTMPSQLSMPLLAHPLHHLPHTP